MCSICWLLKWNKQYTIYHRCRCTIGVVMPMYNIIEYSYNSWNTSGSLWKSNRDWPRAAIVNSGSLKSKIRIIGKTPADGNTKNIKTTVPLKHVSKIDLILIWCLNYVIFSATVATKFALTDTNFSVLVFTLSTQDNAKLLQQLKSILKEQLTGINKYQSKLTTERQNHHLDFLTDPSFRGIKRIFVLCYLK